jgi:hypothetical protein
MSPMRELFVCEAHMGDLMGYFSGTKILGVLYEHFCWPKLTRVCKESVRKIVCLDLCLELTVLNIPL